MKYIISLALKNIWRYKRRTILTFSVLSFGIAIYIMLTGILKGFDDKSFENQIQFETGDFKIRSRSFDEERPDILSNFITNYQEIESVIKSKPYIKAYTERIQFTAELDNGRISSPVLVIGVNPLTENSVFTFSNFISAGSLEKGGAVIGKALAHDMDVSIGDPIYITFRNRQDMIDSIELLISGIINSPNPQVDSSAIFINSDEAKKYLNSDSVTEIVIKTSNYKDYQKFEPDIKKSLPGFLVYDWAKLGEDFMAISQQKSKNAGLLLFFIAIIGLVGIINTMLISVYEKQREIGTLKALGMTNGEIRFLFVFEGLTIGLFGSVVGIILGVLANLYFVIVGFDVTAMFGSGDFGYKVLGVVKSAWDIRSIFGSFFMGVIISAVAAYYPAKKATMLEPAECLRTVQ